MPPKRKSSAPDKPSSKKGTLDRFFRPVVTLPPKPDDEGPATQVVLNEEQAEILRLVVEGGKSIYFSGAAGTGKSLVLRAIIRALLKKFKANPEAVSITASTGMAASHIGGMTLHSWGAISPSAEGFESTLKAIRFCKPAVQRWKNTQVLIIDEVSMVDGKLFDMLARIASALRQQNKPFGGIQVVVTGDFFQLPPVTRTGTQTVFAFESKAWENTIECTKNLSEVFCQKDPVFIDALNSLRMGSPTDEAIALFKSLSRPLSPGPILPTQLFPLRAQVSAANAKRLKLLQHQSMFYRTTDSGSMLKLLDNLLAEPLLELRVGAQVMLIKNVDEVLVNGVVGRIIGFYDPEELISEPDAFVEVDGKKKSALMRNVQLHDDGKTPIGPPIDVEDMARSRELYPLVHFEFPLPDGTFFSEALLIQRDEFRVEDKDGKMLARRLQLPLILAWAMSIHKSQGQTIHRIKVDLSDVFEKGQSYVALSRASSVEGLQVLGFSAHKVQAHPRVIQWHNDTIAALKASEGQV